MSFNDVFLCIRLLKTTLNSFIRANEGSVCHFRQFCCAEIGARVLDGASACLFWMERGACFVLIRQHGGQAWSCEPMLVGSEHQLSELASSNCVPTATWHPAILADSHNTTAHGKYASPVHLFPNRKHPLHIFMTFPSASAAGEQEISPVKRHRRQQKSPFRLLCWIYVLNY